MGFHYKYNASGAHRWLKCHAFKALEPKAPRRKAGQAALVGTAAHFLAEWAFKNGYSTQVDDRLLGAFVRINPHGDAFKIVQGKGLAGFSGIEFVDNASETSAEYPTIIPVDESMIRGVSLYTKTVAAIMDKYPGSSRHVELGFQLAPDMGGMGDVVIVAPGKIIVLDYKNGRGFVDATQNPQLAMYGLGALSRFASTHETHQVVMGIVQPNAESGPPVKTWAQTVPELLVWRDRFEEARWKNVKVERAMEAGKDISGYCNTGAHCKWCPASVVCPVLQTKTMELAKDVPDVNQGDRLPAPVTLDDTRLLWVAEHGDALIDFVEQCRAHMTEQAEQGKAWPGFKLVEKQTKRRFKVDKKLLAKKFREAGKMEAFEPKLKGIGALEKTFGVEAIAPLVEKPAGALELVPESDPRPVHNISVLAQLPDLKGE